MELQEQIFECIATRDWTTAFLLLNEVVDEIGPGNSGIPGRWISLLASTDWVGEPGKTKTGGLYMVFQY